MDICTRGLEFQSHLITHFNLLSRFPSPLSPSSIIMCTDVNQDCYWSLYHAHVTKNQSNDWLLQLSGKWTGKEIPTGNRVPEHQGGGVTNGDLGYPTTTTSVAPARHLQRTAPNQDKKKKRKVHSLCFSCKIQQTTEIGRCYSKSLISIRNQEPIIDTRYSYNYACKVKNPKLSLRTLGL